MTQIIDKRDFCFAIICFET